MKKLIKVAAILMIFCLCFTTMAFAVGEAPEEGGLDEGQTEELTEDAAEPADETTDEAEPGETGDAAEEEAEPAGPADPEEEPAEEAEALPEEAEEPAEEAEDAVLSDLVQAKPGEGVSEEAEADNAPVIFQLPGEEHIEGPVWDEEETEAPYKPDLIENWMSVNDNLGVDGGLVTLDDIPWEAGAYSGTSEGTADGVEQIPSFSTPKEIPLVVLVVGFSNINYNNSYNWGNSVFTASDSLARFYKDQSFNKFTFVPANETSAYGTGGNTNTNDKQNDGIVHVKISDPHRDWSLSITSMDYNESLITECRAIKAAIQASDQYVNYASFDTNGDRKITTNEMGLAVIMAGYEAAYDSSKTEGANYYLWSHAWSLSGGTGIDSSFTLPTPDGVAVNNFITIPEYLEYGTQEPLNVLAHELGHYLGLPDLYDTSGKYTTWNNYDVGAVSLMASNWTWNGSKYIPPSLDAWSKCALGWVRPTVVQNGQYTVQSVQGNYNVLMVQTSNLNEYYLIENRQYTGWDKGLANYGYYSDYASNGGLIFWHIDDAVYEQYDYDNEVNVKNHRPAVMPLYPETTTGSTSGTFTFIGKLPYEWKYRPFWSSSLCSAVTGQTSITLPIYNGSDNPSSRKSTGISCKFLSNSGTSITVQFSGTVKAAYVDRIAGSNRYETAIIGADRLRNDMGVSSFSNIVIASGKDYADALAGSYLAVKTNAPILLVNSNTVKQVASYVKTNMSSSGTVFILGGTGAVPSTMESALSGVGVSSSRIKRLAGANRYETNIEILRYCGVSGKDLLICSGKGYADALSASSLGKPIFLTNNSALTTAQKSYLNSYGSQINYFYAIG
ncbi:MAG: M6 family metalloprotease domain-containing protein, partial [Firmicutes bacterium]|nr:M6 family metalloprotease domain-containing protein [Bacillota bacterium]